MTVVLGFIGVAIFAVLLVAALAPLESLRWWAGWGGDPGEIENRIATSPVSPEADADAFVVYLSGIGSISGAELLPAEAEFIAELRDRLPRARILSDVFPYAATGVALTGNRAFASFWRALHRMRIQGEGTLASLVNLRNMFQVLVSADERYGPVFNYGTSRVIVESLLAHGYSPGARTPVFLLGSSGGGQIALGAASFLEPSLPGSPVEVISLGGVMNSDPGLDAIAHMTHLYGEADSVERLGARIFAGRWKRYPRSAWNRALAAGKIDFVDLGRIEHNGRGGYMDGSTVLADGRSCLEHSVAGVAAAVGARLGAADGGEAA